MSLKTVNEIKAKAKDSEVGKSTIIQNCTSDYPFNNAGALPKKETFVMFLRQGTVPHGDILTNDLCKTIRGEDFIVHECDTLLIFTTPRNLNLLAVKIT